MTDSQVLECGQSSCATLERVNWFPRQLVADVDLRTDRDYFLQKLRRHNRFLHGWGVVCGLDVTAAATDASPWLVEIGSGYALGPYGDDIYVAEPVLFDLAKCGPDAVSDPCAPDTVHGVGGLTGEVYIAIKYAECLARPVRALPSGCGCEEEDCEYSRIRDSFQISCLKDLPPQPGVAVSLCEAVKTPEFF